MKAQIVSIENRGFEERSVLAPVGVRPRGFDGHTALPPYGSPHEDVTLHVGLRSPLSAYPVFWYTAVDRRFSGIGVVSQHVTCKARLRLWTTELIFEPIAVPPRLSLRDC